MNSWQQPLLCPVDPTRSENQSRSNYCGNILGTFNNKLETVISELSCVHIQCQYCKIITVVDYNYCNAELRTPGGHINMAIPLTNRPHKVGENQCTPYFAKVFPARKDQWQFCLLHGRMEDADDEEQMRVSRRCSAS